MFVEKLVAIDFFFFQMCNVSVLEAPKTKFISLPLQIKVSLVRMYLFIFL